MGIRSLSREHMTGEAVSFASVSTINAVVTVAAPPTQRPWGRERGNELFYRLIYV